VKQTNKQTLLYIAWEKYKIPAKKKYQEILEDTRKFCFEPFDKRALQLVHDVITNPETKSDYICLKLWKQRQLHGKYNRKTMTVTKQFGIDFNSRDGALTLDPAYVLNIQSSGWKITGRIKEDYYEWVNEFEAVHPFYGKVWGDFEDKVYADTEEGFNHFYKNHPPKAWDYQDI
jgi:hypothetical protein